MNPHSRNYCIDIGLGYTVHQLLLRINKDKENINILNYIFKSTQCTICTQDETLHYDLLFLYIQNYLYTYVALYQVLSNAFLLLMFFVFSIRIFHYTATVCHAEDEPFKLCNRYHITSNKCPLLINTPSDFLLQKALIVAP